ncbi:MAG: iron chaperone [Deltaproteobacteria bacterium]
MATKKAKTVDEYIQAAPPEARARLRQMRACIRKAAPGAIESLKWSMPAFSAKRILVMYAAFKNHVSLFPTPSPMKAFAKDLEGFKTGRGSIQFPLEKPLPLALIRKITLYRVRESAEKDAKWRS